MPTEGRNKSTALEVDATLAEAARTGDEKAFSQLVDRHYRTVYALAYSRVGNWAAAEDIAQEAFLVAYANLRRLRKPGVFLMWLRRIVRNLSARWVRSETYRRKLDERLSAEGEKQADVRDGIDRHEQAGEVWDALRTLSPNVREAMVLYYMEGKSGAEVARALGVTENAVRTRLYQGRKKMREYFEKRMESELRKPAPKGAKERVLMALAIGPAVPQIGQSVSGTGLGLWMHHALHGGTSALLKPALTGGAIMTFKQTTGIVVAGLVIGTVLYVGLGTSKEDRQTDVPTNTSRHYAVEAPIEPLLVQETSREQETAETATFIEDVEAFSTEAEHEPGEILDPSLYCSVSGRVTDTAGIPIRDALVIVVSLGYDDEAFETLDQYALDKKWRDRSHQFHTTTDPWGEYTVTGIRFCGTAIVWAYANGYVMESSIFDSVRTFTLKPGDTKEGVGISLTPGKTLRGRVIAVDGSPVSNAVVYTAGAWNTRNELYIGGLVYTDYIGRFSFGYYRKVERCSLHIISDRHGKYTFTDIPIGEEEVVLRMQERSALSGTVKWSGGRSVEGLVVLLQGIAWSPPQGGTYRSGTLLTEYAATIDGRGRYDITEIDPGQSYGAIVAREDHTPLTPKNDLPSFAPGQAAVWDCVVHHGITIRGRVLGENTGRLLKDVRVRCLKDGESIQDGEQEVKSDGCFEFNLVTGPGSYLVHPLPKLSSGDPRARLAALYGKEVQLSAGEEIELDLSFFEPFTIQVRAVDIEGNPIEGTRTELVQRAGIGSFRGRWQGEKPTDENGRFSWSGFRPELEAWIVLSKNGYVESESSHYIGQPGEVFPEETIVLHRSSGVTGIALDENETPIPDALIEWVLHCDGDSTKVMPTLKTDSEGAFARAYHVPATEVIFEMTVDDGARKYRWVSEPVECVADHIMDFGEIVFAPLND